MSSDPELWQLQWMNDVDELEWSGMSSNLAHVTNASVAPYPMLDHPLDGPLCGWSCDIKPRLPPLSIPSIPQPLSPMLTSSCPDTEQYPWLWHTQTFNGIMDTCASSPERDASFTASDFLRALADYDCTPDVRADPQPSVVLPHNAISSPQSSGTSPYSEYSICEPSVAPKRNAISSPRSSATFSYSEFPTCEPPRQDRYFECHWLTNGGLCGKHVMPNRCSVIAHVQDFHGIKPGEEKAREMCFWEHCGTVLRKESLARHILTVHLKEKVHCAECRLGFAREDSLKRHLKGSQHKVTLDKSAARRSSRSHIGSG